MLVFYIHTGVNIYQAAFLMDQGINPTAAAASGVKGLGGVIVVWGSGMGGSGGVTVAAIVSVW